VILREAWHLFLHGSLPQRPVRLIGVGISDWREAAAEPLQPDLFDPPRKPARDERLLETLDRVTERFGQGVLQLGCANKAGRHGPW
jgi:DNA polymerase-4